MNKLFHTLSIAAVLAGLLPVAQAQDAKAGEAKAAMCIGCHGIPGYQASFPEVYKVPKIAGQNAKFLVSALVAYQKGERKHPTMRGIAGSLSDKDMADLSAYYEQLGKAAAAPDAATPPADVAALLTKGACNTCHGANFSKPIDPSYPKIAGQEANYLYAALKSYQTVGNPLIGRSNPIMVAQIKPFSHAELKRIADYLGSLQGEIKTVPQSLLH